MDQINQEYITRLKGRYTEKYATQMDDWTAIILYEVSENVAALMRENNERLDLSINKIQEASDKIREDTKQIYFDNYKEAFCHGFGHSLLYGLSLLFSIFFLFWIYISNKEFETKRALINRFPSIEKFEMIYREGEVISKDGYEFLVAYPAKGDVVEFARNYEYEKDKKRILIPIRKK